MNPTLAALRGWVVLLSLLLSMTATAQPGTLQFTLNGRSVGLPLETQVIIDDQLTTLGTVRQFPNGMRVEWSGMVPFGGDRGALLPVFSFQLIGPVTGNSPLEVLGQPITVTADTVLSNVTAPVNLPLNTPVVVSGLVDPNGSVLATLVERRGAFGNSFLLTGPVEVIDGANLQLRVGAQWVSYQGAIFNGCAESLPRPGEFVAVRTQAQPNYVPGSVLTTMISGQCLTLVPAGTAGATGFLQGTISSVPTTGSFLIDALTVNLSSNTEFIFGARDDLETGVVVNIDGNFVDAQTFDATVVEFNRPMVRFEAPMTPADVIPGVSLRAFGVLVRNTAQVRDEDLILANGLTQTRQVEVRGYLDRVGRAYATRVRERGAPDFADVSLRGPVQTIAPPRLSIQGLEVDTTGAIFRNELGQPLLASEFFALLAVTHMVDASGAVYNPATATLTGGVITYIGAEPVRIPRARLGSPPVNAGTASGYSLATPLFIDGFEG
ncbi:MAG TPA: DUF5666 domain-containing protein [Xanthomonadales bacterium]|nr:DUF5666 domain-containing protein [Xanthomonadales bacterium]